MTRWPAIVAFIILWTLVPVSVFGLAAFYTPWLAGFTGGTGGTLLGVVISGELARLVEPVLYAAGLILFLHIMFALRSEGLQQRLAYYNVRPTMPAEMEAGQPAFLQLTAPPSANTQGDLVAGGEGSGPHSTSDLMELASQVLQQDWRQADQVRQALARVDLSPDAFALLYHLMLDQRHTVETLARQSGYEAGQVAAILEDLAAQDRVGLGRELCRLRPQGRRILRQAAEELARALEGETLKRIWELARA